MSPTRREFLGTVAGSFAAGSAALVGLSCKGGARPVAGGFVDDGGALGHRLRDGAAVPAPRETVRTGIVIVGGGMAGLSAAWRLRTRGFTDFTILELERDAGGNSRSGENEVAAYPWGAHYVPVPDAGAALVRELFTELGVLSADGQWDERALCQSPQERLFAQGEWRLGLEPETGGLRRGEREELERFQAAMAEHRASGAFALPIARGRPSSGTEALDRLSMAAWMEQQRFTSPALRWYVDYACRDDFGAHPADVSAWAGIHYFAARPADEIGPLTWPEGNGWIAKRLLERVGGHVVTGAPAYRVARAGARWRVLTPRTAYEADAVIWAAPSFVAPHVIEAAPVRPADFVYSPWLTANLTLERWPRERGAPPAWDNVIRDSPALGYVVATHQSLRTVTERSVWTWYLAIADLAPAEGRRLLQRRAWRDWVEVILADLERAHPDIRDCVSRVDVLRLGHAMIRPTVGFRGSAARARLKAAGEGRLYFGHSDLSGLSVFEEAQHHGVTAAERAMAAVGATR